MRHPACRARSAGLCATRPAACAGYVRHLAADGAQYWLMALSVPVAADGMFWLGFKPGETFAAPGTVRRGSRRRGRGRGPRPAPAGARHRGRAGMERLGDFEAAMRGAFVAEVEARASVAGGPSGAARANCSRRWTASATGSPATARCPRPCGASRASWWTRRGDPAVLAERDPRRAPRRRQRGDRARSAELLKTRSDAAAPEILRAGPGDRAAVACSPRRASGAPRRGWRSSACSRTRTARCASSWSR